MRNTRLLLAGCAAGTLVAVAFAGRPAANGTPTKLLRMPTVSATQIAFAYANNIWTVERNGGVARRITSFQGATTNPKFSPDGKWIAFSAEYSGNVDAYVVPAEGGVDVGAGVHAHRDLAHVGVATIRDRGCALDAVVPRRHAKFRWKLESELVSRWPPLLGRRPTR